MGGERTEEGRGGCGEEEGSEGGTSERRGASERFGEEGIRVDAVCTGRLKRSIYSVVVGAFNFSVLLNATTTLVSAAPVGQTYWRRFVLTERHHYIFVVASMFFERH